MGDKATAAAALSSRRARAATSPRGLSYGPRESPMNGMAPGHPLGLALQFGGSSGYGFTSIERRRQARQELIEVGGHVDGLFYVRPVGSRQWDLTTIWEHVFGDHLSTPPALHPSHRRRSEAAQAPGEKQLAGAAYAGLAVPQGRQVNPLCLAQVRTRLSKQPSPRSGRQVDIQQRSDHLTCDFMRVGAVDQVLHEMGYPGVGDMCIVRRVHALPRFEHFLFRGVTGGGCAVVEHGARIGNGGGRGRDVRWGGRRCNWARSGARRHRHRERRF